MIERPKELKSLFKQFKDGDPEALEAVIASEKERLFDYLMRMTGQLSRSMEIMQETISGVTNVGDQEETLAGFFVLFYRTARSFAMEIWNAETPKLENSAYADPDSGLSERITIQLIEIERVLRSLPAKQREILLLSLRYEFDLSEVSTITGYPEDDVEELLSQAQSVMEAALNKSTAKLKEGLGKLLVFPMPDDGNDGTQNLSIVVRDLKRSSKSTPGGLFRLILGLAFVAAVVFVVWRHELVLDYLKTFLEP